MFGCIHSFIYFLMNSSLIHSIIWKPLPSHVILMVLQISHANKRRFWGEKKKGTRPIQTAHFFLWKGTTGIFCFHHSSKKKINFLIINIYIYIYIHFRTVYLQGFQSETNHYSHWVGPRWGKALAQEILFKVQIAGLKLKSIPNRAQYKHLETESPTNSTNP